MRDTQARRVGHSVELFLTAVVLYLWQCVVFLPLGGAAFLSVRSFAAKARRGPGFHLLSPWPGDISIVSGGLPFELGIDEVYAPSPLPRGDLSLIEDTAVSLDGSERFRVRGSNVVAGGRVFLRAASPHHAEHLAETLQRLKETASPKRSAVLRGLVDAAYDLSAFRAALASSTRVVRPLQWCCDAVLDDGCGRTSLTRFVLERRDRTTDDVDSPGCRPHREPRRLGTRGDPLPPAGIQSDGALLHRRPIPAGPPADAIRVDQ